METLKNTYCHELPTKPIPGLKILVTGATGYIGGELVPELLSRGYQVRILVRDASKVQASSWPDVEFFTGDARMYNDLLQAMEGIDCAYYLMHSLNAGKFIEVDRQVATNFRQAAEENKVKRIIYLGGLGDPDIQLSDHLKSRQKVAQELQKGRVPVTHLRAAVIIGAGSTSFKIINHLVQNCPVFVFPRRSVSDCQPIAVEDVIKYLIGCLETSETTGRTLDIGSQEILSYLTMLKAQARILGKKRLFMTSSYTSISSSALIADWLTPVSYQVIKPLMESCNQDAVCQNDDIRSIIPFKTLSYDDAVKKALNLETQAPEIPVYPKEKREEHIKVEIDHSPPGQSKSIFSDIKNFLIHKPSIRTLVRFKSHTEREDYTYRILQRLDVGVTKYNILNIHKIGVNAPVKYIFEEIIKWDGDSTCWPNHLAKVIRDHNQLEHLDMYLFGISKFPVRLKKILKRFKLIPFFSLKAIHFHKIPDTLTPDNSRYLLYECTGGYPIGVFTMYVRSSIAEEEEKEQSQLFLMVGFNFYGRKNWSNLRLINRLWESIHDRVTNNVLFRIKQLSEWRFDKIQNG